MQVLQLYTQGTFFFYAALRQNKGLSCSSWWLDSMLSLWEWEALGLRETENLMSSLFEEGKIFQHVFQSSGEALPHLGRCSSSRWKSYNPCLQSSSPQRLPCPPSLWMHIFSHWLKWNHLPLCDSLDLFTDMAHTAMSPAGTGMHRGNTQISSCTTSFMKTRNMGSEFVQKCLGVELTSGPWTRLRRPPFWAGSSSENWPKNIRDQNGNCHTTSWRARDPAQQEQSENTVLWKYLWELWHFRLFSVLNILCNAANKNKPQPQNCLQSNWAAGWASARPVSVSPVSPKGKACRCCQVCDTDPGKTPQRPWTQSQLAQHRSHGPPLLWSSSANSIPCIPPLPSLLLGHSTSSAEASCLVGPPMSVYWRWPCCQLCLH